MHLDRRAWPRHLRLPLGSGLGLFVWGFLLAIGDSNAMAFLVGALTFGCVFLFVRKRGVQGHLRKR